MNEMFKKEDYFTLSFVQHINVPYNGNKSDLTEYCNTILSVLAFFHVPDLTKVRFWYWPHACTKKLLFSNRILLIPLS